MIMFFIFYITSLTIGAPICNYYFKFFFKYSYLFCVYRFYFLIFYMTINIVLFFYFFKQAGEPNMCLEELIQHFRPIFSKRVDSKIFRNFVVFCKFLIVCSGCKQLCWERVQFQSSIPKLKNFCRFQFVSLKQNENQL